MKTVMTNCIHHFVIDDKLLGICKHCDLIKQYEDEPVLVSKHRRRFWEISYEKLREDKFKLDEENADED